MVVAMGDRPIQCNADAHQKTTHARLHVACLQILLPSMPPHGSEIKQVRYTRASEEPTVTHSTKAFAVYCSLQRKWLGLEWDIYT